MSIFINNISKSIFTMMFLLLNFHLKQLFQRPFSTSLAQDVVKHRNIIVKLLCFFILLYQHMVLSHLIIRGARFFKMWPEGLQILNSLKDSDLGEIFKSAGKGGFSDGLGMGGHLLPKYTLYIYCPSIPWYFTY